MSAAAVTASILRPVRLRLFNGRDGGFWKIGLLQDGHNLTRVAEENQLEEAGLVVIFGQSDDLVALRGAIDEEVGAYEGATLYFYKDGLLENERGDDDCPYFEKIKEGAPTISALWGENEKGFSWTFKTALPHETFSILEDGEPYCRGIAFEMASLKA